MNQDQNLKEQAPAASQKPQAPAAQPAPPVSRAQILVFWGAVAAAVAAARGLAVALPGIPERVVEQWLMLAFGIFLAGFLLRLK